MLTPTEHIQVAERSLLRSERRPTDEEYATGSQMRPEERERLRDEAQTHALIAIAMLLPRV